MTQVLLGFLVGMVLGALLVGLLIRAARPKLPASRKLRMVTLPVWTCRGCGRPFDGSQPAFIDAGEAEGITTCIDCSH